MAAVEQICFTDEANCLAFTGHMLKANICINCMKDIGKHSKNTVKEEDVIKALEFTQKGERIPSLILEKNGTSGKLFLGGFKTAINTEFIKSEDVKGIVNTVGSGIFNLFGKKFQSTYHETINKHELSCLLVEWEDSVSYEISNEDLENVIRHIHKIRTEGGSVLVHCAQGKSRSTTAVVAYIMTLMNMTATDALSFVKEKRKMAEPNAHFIYLLKQYEKSELLNRLRSDIGSTTYD